MTGNGETPVLDTLTAMTAISIEETDLDPATFMRIRLAALIAVDAPPASYLLNLGPAVESGLTMEDAQSVLVAVAPIVGAPRVVSAAGNIAQALGFAIALDEAIMEAEEERQP